MFEMLLVLLLIIITVISVTALGPRGSNRGYKKGSSSRCSSSSSLLCSDVRLWTVVFVGCCKVTAESVFFVLVVLCIYSECVIIVLLLQSFCFTSQHCHHVSEYTAYSQTQQPQLKIC